MKKQAKQLHTKIRIAALLSVLLLALLAACGGSSELPAPQPAPQQVAEPTPAPQPEEIPKPRILEFDKFMAESIEEVGANPAAFGEFFTTYLEQNGAPILPPYMFKPSDVGRLFDVPLTEKPQPTEENKSLIIYNQVAHDEAGIESVGGVFLDCMALLPAEQIPDSLLAYDKLIAITATAETASTYESGLLGIRWTIEVSCTDIAGGETRTEPFDGGAPPYVAVYSPGDKYISGGFPIYDAVDYALLLAANEPGAPLPAPVPPPPPMMVSSPDEAEGVPTRSPQIVIEDPPEDAVCFALIMTDDEGFVYWLATNFTATQLAANASIDNAANMVQGRNDFGSVGYSSPTPTDNSYNSYNIAVYALDAELPLVDGYSQEEFDAVFFEHMLDIAALNIMYFN